MGEAKRRKATGNHGGDRNPRIEILDPRDRAHRPGTLTIHILCEHGASVSGSVALGDVDKAIAIGKRAAKQTGLVGNEARMSARSWIANTMTKNEHMREGGASMITTLAMWLASTVPDPQGALIRQAIRHDAVLALSITEHSIYGRRAINGRTMIFPPETPLEEILGTFGMGPSAEAVKRELAPH
jgi:hypothetical protein